MRSGTRRNDQVRNAKITRNYIGGYKNGRIYSKYSSNCKRK